MASASVAIFGFRVWLGFCGTTVMVALARSPGCPSRHQPLGRRDFQSLQTTFFFAMLTGTLSDSVTGTKVRVGSVRVGNVPGRMFSRPETLMRVALLPM